VGVVTEFEWKLDGNANRWEMPSAAWWKRLPVIRHFRAACHGVRAERHYQMWHRSTGALNTGYDRWVLWGIANGKERPK
jgi:hypothetical protein